MKICAQRKAGTRKRARLLPIVPCASLPVTRVSRSPLCSAKNEAPEEEAAPVDTAQRLAPKQQKKQNKTKKSPVLNLNVTKLGERALVNGKNERFEQNPIWTLTFHFQFSFCSHFSFSRSSYSFRLPFSVLVTSVKFYLVFLVDIGGYCSLQSEELEEGNCQSLVNGTSGPYYAMECHVPYYYYYYKRDSKIRKCLSKWCSLIALCFNETSDWRKLCYKKFNWFRWSNFDISTATKDVNVSNVTNIYIKNCGWKRSLPRFKIKATGYRCASKTAQRGTYPEIKHC